MIHRKKPDVDIIQDVLEATLEAYPASAFVQSLLNQYQERGGLSKKQLEGLYHKAARAPNLPPNKLATLEAESAALSNVQFKLLIKVLTPEG